MDTSARDPDTGAGEGRPVPLDSTAVTARILGEPLLMPRRQVSAAAGASLLSARRFWHALGFPRVGDDDSMFTEADMEALASVVRMVRVEQMDESSALAMTRAVARSADRLSDWLTSLIREMLTDPEESGEHRQVGAADVAERLLDMNEQLEVLLLYAWRRHAVAAITQLLAEAEPADAHIPVRTVGFADMVEFTPLVRRLTERELAHLVQHFYTLATDVVTAHGGRLVKTIGDEVVFVTDDAGPAAAIALDLVDELTENPSIPRLRVGIATGPVAFQLGDVFGTTVNRASRMTDVARPGTVLIDDACAAALTRVPGFRMMRLRSKTLRGLGPTRLWVLRRTSESERRGFWHDGGGKGGATLHTPTITGPSPADDSGAIALPTLERRRDAGERPGASEFPTRSPERGPNAADPPR